jgi:GTPase SAR1 family protein
MCAKKQRPSWSTEPPADHTADQVIDMFEDIGLPVCDKGDLIKQKFDASRPRYLKMQRDPTPSVHDKGQAGIDNGLEMADHKRRSGLLRVVYDKFVQMTNVSLKGFLASGGKRLTPELRADLMQLVVDQCKCDADLAKAFVEDYRDQKGIEGVIEPPGSVQGVKADPLPGRVHLAWQPPQKNCERLIVRRFEATKDGDFERKGKIIYEGDSHSDGCDDRTVKAGQEYRYRVFSVWRGVESAGVSDDTMAVDEISGERAKWENDGVTLSWRRPAADCETFIFRATSSITLTPHAVSSEPRVQGPQDAVLIYHGEEEQYKDRDAVLSKRYHYLLVAHFAPGYYSNGVGLSYHTPIPPSSVKSAVAECARKHVKISWKRVPSRDPLQYIVVRTDGDVPAGSPDDGERVKKTSNESCVDKQAQNGRMYTYTIFALREVPSEKGCSTAPVVVTADVSDLQIEEGDGAVTLRWQEPPEAHCVIVRRSLKRITHPDEGKEVPLAGPGQAHDTGLDNDQEYHYLLCCSYLIEGEQVLSKGIKRTAVPCRLPGEVTGFRAAQKGNRVVCAWELDGPGTVVVVRTDKPLPYKAGAMLMNRELQALGYRLSASETDRATDTNPTSAEPYYTAFVVAGSNVRVGLWERCVVARDISQLHLKSEAGGVRLRWIWPDEECTAVAIVRRKGEMPTGIDDPQAIKIDCSRIDYEQNHNSFLDRNAGKDKVCYAIYARPHDAPEMVYSSGLSAECRGCIHPAGFGQLRYSMQIKRKLGLLGPQSLLLKWTFDIRPGNFSGFQLVSSERVAPSEPTDGTELFCCAPGDPEWESQEALIPLNKHLLQALDHDDLYCRIFHLDPTERERILIVHPDLSIPCGKLVNRPNPKSFSHKPPTKMICPRCLEEFSLTDAGGQSLIDGQCPGCGRELPWSTGRQKDLIIGMVGAKYSGKSHYVATLIERLQHQGWRDFCAGCTHVDDDTKDRYRDEFSLPLYGSKIEVPPTQSNAIPLLYNFRVDGSLWGKREPDRAVTLALYDTAGEDFASAATVERFAKYISQASGLIFLIDPLQIPAIRQLVGAAASLPVPHEFGDPQQILGTVIGELEKRGLISGNRKLDIPVAIVLTKCDVLRDMELIEPDRVWHSDLHHYRRYDLTLHDDINGFFSQLLARLSPGAYGTIKVSFKNHALFGVSATGCSSDQDGRFPFVSPWRVQDPLLWILYQLGVIPGGESQAL